MSRDSTTHLDGAATNHFTDGCPPIAYAKGYHQPNNTDETMQDIVRFTRTNSSDSACTELSCGKDTIITPSTSFPSHSSFLSSPSSSSSSSYIRSVSLTDEGCPVTPITPKLDHHGRHCHDHHIDVSGVSIDKNIPSCPTSMTPDSQASMTVEGRRLLLAMRLNALSPSTTPQKRRKTLVRRPQSSHSSCRTQPATPPPTTTTTTTSMPMPMSTSDTILDRNSNNNISRCPPPPPLLLPINNSMFIPSMVDDDDDNDNDEEKDHNCTNSIYEESDMMDVVDDNVSEIRYVNDHHRHCYDHKHHHRQHDHPRPRRTDRPYINTDGMSPDGKTLFISNNNNFFGKNISKILIHEEKFDDDGMM